MKLFFTGVILSAVSFTFKNATAEKNKIRMNTMDIVGELTCNQSNTWEPLKFKTKAIRNVCIEKNYQPMEPPNKSGMVPLLYFFYTSRIMGVNEKKKTIQVDIKLKLAWEDSRLQATFLDGDNGRITLPPVTKYSDPLIWTPFQSYYIYRVKDMKYLKDPVRIGPIRLYSSNFFQSKSISPNRTLVTAWIEWHVTVSCELDFVLFPFGISSS